MLRKVVLLIICLALLHSDGFAEEKIKIAVMDLDAKNVPKATAFAVSDLLRNDLYASKKYTIVERSQMEKILKEQMFQQTGCVSTECAVEVGKILNATQMIVGSISTLGLEYSITIRVVDVETTETKFSATLSCKYEAEFKNVSKAIISKLTGVGVSTLLTEENTSFDVAKFSAMFPGWGQFNNGQELKGCLIAFAEIAALSGAIYTYVQYNKAVEDYDAAPIGSDFPVLVKTIQDLSNLNKVYLWSALGIWVYGVIDPYLFGINKDRKFTLDYNNDKFKLAYSIKF